MNRRQFILGSSLLTALGATAAEKTTDGGLAAVNWPARRRKARPALPPGAHGMRNFAAKCVGCGLCTTVCPSHCLRTSTEPSRLGRVELDFRHGWCRPNCVACAMVCPTGALERLPALGHSPQDAVGHSPHIGYAVWQRKTCIRVTEGVDCHACEKHCPVRAVKLIAGVPVIDRTACIGCGACEHYCPARPLTAIHVEGYEQHREYAPMSQDDLVDELRRLIDDGHSAVIARDGVIVDILEGRGLKPIEDALSADEACFAGAIVADKVVGLGAAKLYIGQSQVSNSTVKRPSFVYGRVMSEGAKSRLEAAGVPVGYGTLVPILDCER